MENFNQGIQDPYMGIGAEEKSNVVSTTNAVLKSEYLAGGLLGNGDTLLSLSHDQPFYFGHLSDAIIAKMLRDPEIYKCLSVIKNGVLGDGVMFGAAISAPTIIEPPKDGEEESPRRAKERKQRDAQVLKYEQSKKYAEFLTRAFKNLEIPLRFVLPDMMDALPYGNRVAEKVFETVFDKEFNRDLLYLKRLKVKPRNSTIFVVDRFKNLIGLKAFVKVKGENGEDTYKAKIIKKDKFAILTFGSVNSDPRGTSFLEPVYTAWQLKMQLWPEYLRWIIYSAVPPIVGYTSDQVESRKVIRGVDGEIVKDASGNPVFESDVGPLLAALAQVRNASAIALPHGAKVEVLTNGVSGDPFRGFKDVLNSEMEMALINQTLATSDSRNNTRAASQTHISILDELVWNVKGVVREMIVEIVRHLMDINFAGYDKDLMPEVIMGDTARREFSGDVGAISQLSISGYLGESQKAGIDSLLGLPPRDAYSDREYDRQKAKEKAELLVVSKQGSTPAVPIVPLKEEPVVPPKDKGV